QRPADLEERAVEDVLQRPTHVPEVGGGDEKVAVRAQDGRGMLLPRRPGEGGHRGDRDILKLRMACAPKRGLKQPLDTRARAVVDDEKFGHEWSIPWVCASIEPTVAASAPDGRSCCE